MNNLHFKVLKIKEFNNVVISFLNQIEHVCKVSYTSQFKTIIENNNTLPIDKFIAYAFPLRDKILKKDESYFYNTNLIESDDVSIMDQILNLKNIYSKLDEKSKNSIWNFIQAMLIISDEYVSLKLEKN